MSPLFSKLGDVAEFINGAAFKPEDWGEDGKRIIRIQNLNDPTKPYNRTTRVIPERLHVYPGDILVSWSASLGVFEWGGPDIGLLNQHIFRVLPDTSLVDKRYLRHALELALLDMQRHLHGATMMHVNRGEFLATKLFLPSIPEQRRIAAILDQADALRTKRREALAQLDSLTQSIFIEMFGDARENDRGWPKANIESFISDMKGGAPLEPDDFIDEGFPILHKGAIKPNGEIQLDSKKKTYVALEYAEGRPRCIATRDYVAVTLRDLVPSGPSIGLTVDLRNGPFDKYILAQGAYAFQIDEKIMTREFFVQLSNMPTFRYVLKQNAVGSTQIHIRTPIYLAIEVPVPPIKLQQEFSNRVRAARAVREEFQKSDAELSNLSTSLQHRAFRGQL